MKIPRRPVLSLLVACSLLTGGGGLAASAVHAAPRAAVCAGYSTATCSQTAVRAHSIRTLSFKKAAGLRIVVKTGAKGVAIALKKVSKPAGAPNVPGSKGKKTAFFTFHEKGKGAHLNLRGKGALYAYNPATNKWQKVRKNNLKPGKVYAWVAKGKKGKKK